MHWDALRRRELLARFGIAEKEFARMRDETNIRRELEDVECAEPPVAAWIAVERNRVDRERAVLLKTPDHRSMIRTGTNPAGSKRMSTRMPQSDPDSKLSPDGPMVMQLTSDQHSSDQHCRIVKLPAVDNALPSEVSYHSLIRTTLRHMLHCR